MGGGPKRRLRQADIAKAAGVSQATVSLVLNDPDGVRHPVASVTRQKVLRAVEELGYVANVSARSLAGGRNNLIGVFTLESVFPVDHRDFYYPFLVGIESEAERRNLDLLLFTSLGAPDGSRSIYAKGTNRLHVSDGSIILGVRESRGELERLVSEGFPVVFVGRREFTSGPVAYVGADYVGASHDLVAHLSAHGHRRIGYLGWQDTSERTVDRLTGIKRAFNDPATGLDYTTILSVSIDDVDAGLAMHLAEQRVSAAVVQDDAIAEALEDSLRDLGLGVPDDFSIAVTGDPARGSPARRHWTRFSIPREQMGSEALGILADLIEASSVRSELPNLMLDCVLVEGDSCSRVDG